MEEKNKLEILMKSKNLVETSYNITAIQNRIFYYCLYSAQKEKTGELSCTIKLQDLKNLIPNKNQSTLANIKKTFSVLKNSVLLFDKQVEGDLIECEYNLIAGSEYNTNKQEFKIYFMQRLYNHILEYSNYAPLNIKILSKFTSFYAQRLYEALRMWSRTGNTIKHSFSIEDLRFILGVGDKYPEYKNFKQRALSQALKEINSMGNMEVGLREIKEGRKVSKIEFIILDHEPKVYFKNNFKNIPTAEVPTVLKDDTGEDIKENAPASAIAEAVITSFGNYTSNNSKRMERNKKQEEILNISPSGNYIMNNSKRLKGKVVTSEQLKKSEELENDLTFWYIQE